MAGKRKAGQGPKPTGPDKPAKLRRNGKPRKQRKQRTRWQKVRRVLLWLLALVLVGSMVVAGGFVYLYKTTKLPDPNKDFQTQTSFVYYNNGKDELGRYAVQNREIIDYSTMPQDIKDAVVAIENPTFWKDKGIDFKGIIRAALNNARGGATQGASTITQQYIKVMYLTEERSYTRKLKEAILALKLQRQVSKQEILDNYLNTIYFGRGAYGVQAAAEAYFQIDAKDLTLAQSAALAAIINNPTEYDPANGKTNKRALRDRYRKVLDDMAAQGDIGSDDAQSTGHKLPKFPPKKSDSQFGGQKGHVLTMVKNALLQLPNKSTGQNFTPDEIDGGGLRITTTFTHTAMDAAEAGVLAQRPDGFSDKKLHIAVASVQPGTGAVRGIYAGQDFLESQINWAVAGGQGGSSMKPFALAAGLKAGYTLKSTFDGNSPFTLDDGTEINNEQDTDYGASVDLTKALEESINTAFTDLTVSIPDGPEQILKMMNAMGIPPDKGPGKHYGFPNYTAGLQALPSITLGPATVSPINLANGYATIANGGVEADPYIIEKVASADGTVLYDHQVVTHQAVSSDIDSNVSYAMQQVVQHGTGTAALALGRPAAGKTGTATNSLNQVSSAWFTGFTPQMSTAVMYVRGKGNEQLDGWLPSYFGADYPARTWTAVMQAEMDGQPVVDFPTPATLTETAPEPGHEPTTPSPTKKPTKTPSSQTTETTTTPSTETPTTTPTTQAPTTTTPSVPTDTLTPTPSDSCGLLGCAPSSPSSPTDTGTATAGTSSPAAREREIAASERSWLAAAFGW